MFDCQTSSALSKTLCAHHTYCNFIYRAILAACIYASWLWNVLLLYDHVLPPLVVASLQTVYNPFLKVFT